MPQDSAGLAPDKLGQAGSAPFELTTFLAGRTRAWGLIEDRFGRVRRRFEVDMHGHWQGPLFHLDERFAHDTGQIEQRNWVVKPGVVKPGAGGAFTATCADCVGEAVGSARDDVIRMRYRFRLQLPSRLLLVDMDDRIHRIGATTAVNRTTMRKWGIRIAELALFFEKA